MADRSPDRLAVGDPCAPLRARWTGRAASATGDCRRRVITQYRVGLSPYDSRVRLLWRRANTPTFTRARSPILMKKHWQHWRASPTTFVGEAYTRRGPAMNVPTRTCPRHGRRTFNSARREWRWIHYFCGLHAEGRRLPAGGQLLLGRGTRFLRFQRVRSYADAASSGPESLSRAGPSPGLSALTPPEDQAHRQRDPHGGGHPLTAKGRIFPDVEP